MGLTEHQNGGPWLWGLPGFSLLGRWPPSQPFSPGLLSQLRDPTGSLVLVASYQSQIWDHLFLQGLTRKIDFSSEQTASLFYRCSRGFWQDCLLMAGAQPLRAAAP